MAPMSVPATPAVLVLGADAATFGLLREWLSEAGYAVAAALGDAAPAAGPATPTVSCRDGRYDLVIVDVPYPRALRAEPQRRLAAIADGAPVLALSATFHSNVERSGEVARSLGVAGVLPKPLRRDALVSAVHHLSRRPPSWTPPTP